MIKRAASPHVGLSTLHQTCVSCSPSCAVACIKLTWTFLLLLLVPAPSCTKTDDRCCRRLLSATTTPFLAPRDSIHASRVGAPAF
eukprot:5010689-Pleurochrysis_carterae.AAC.1